MFLGLAALLPLVWLATLGQPAAVQSRRGPLRGNSARDAERRRLGHSALERPRLHREAAAAVLGHGLELVALWRRASLRRGSIRRCVRWARWPWCGSWRRGYGAQPAGWRAAAVLSGMLLFVVLGQLLTLDMSLTFYMTSSLAGILAGAAQRQRRVARWMLLAWGAAALGVLTKGLVAAAIPAAVLLCTALYSRDCRAVAPAAVGVGPAAVSGHYGALALAGGAPAQ